MSKASGHYSGWVRRGAVKSGFTGPIGVTTTPDGYKVVKFANPPSAKARKLEAAMSGRPEPAKVARGARA